MPVLQRRNKKGSSEEKYPLLRLLCTRLNSSDPRRAHAGKQERLCFPLTALAAPK